MAASNSPSSSSTTSSSTTTRNRNPNPNPNPPSNPTQSWWESISLARSRIQALATLLSLPSLSSLADSDRPSLALLSSPLSYSALSGALSASSSGHASDPLCQWLYETYQLSDADLRLVVLSFLPLISHLYLSRLISSPYSSSLAGFESVLLSVYQSETRSRSGKPILISVPDLTQPSLYHVPRSNPKASTSNWIDDQKASAAAAKVGILSPPLEPQTAMKSTKRAAVIGVALDCYFKKVAVMPLKSKVDFCEFVVSWCGQDCSCRFEFDEEEEEEEEEVEFEKEIGRLEIRENNGNGKCEDKGGCRVPLPWEMMQPMLRILGHCLLTPRNSEDVRDKASMAVRSVYARAVHDLTPQVILAARSLIQLDKSTRKAGADGVGVAVAGGLASNPSTPSKPKKPEVLLVSK